MCCVRVQWRSQFPLEDGDRRVGVSAARQLHILAVQVPVSIEALDLHVRFICKEATLKSAQADTKINLNTVKSFTLIVNWLILIILLSTVFFEI